jgi:hypothetical protein
MAGATAVGGGDFTVVVLFEVESVVDLLVESVTMGSAAIAGDKTMTKSTLIAVFLIILLPICWNVILIVLALRQPIFSDSSKLI